MLWSKSLKASAFFTFRCFRQFHINVFLHIFIESQGIVGFLDNCFRFFVIKFKARRFTGAEVVDYVVGADKSDNCVKLFYSRHLVHPFCTMPLYHDSANLSRLSFLLFFFSLFANANKEKKNLYLYLLLQCIQYI